MAEPVRADLIANVIDDSYRDRCGQSIADQEWLNQVAATVADLVNGVPVRADRPLPAEAWNDLYQRVMSAILADDHQDDSAAACADRVLHEVITPEFAAKDAKIERWKSAWQGADREWAEDRKLGQWLVAEARAEAVDLRDLLGAIWLYISWRYVTKQLTTEQKEMWADAVEEWQRRINGGVDPADDEVSVDRWWRPDSAPGPVSERERDARMLAGLIGFSTGLDVSADQADDLLQRDVPGVPSGGGTDATA